MTCSISLLILSVFGWVANPGFGFLESIFVCLVAYKGARAWFGLAKSSLLDWLQENDQIGDQS